VAFNGDGNPHSPPLCRRVLHGEQRIPAQLMVFDLLATDGECLLARTYADGRAQLNSLGLQGRRG
jgi:ATP-dependent DNA ligase